MTLLPNITSTNCKISKNPYFLLPTFPLVDKIGAHFIIWKHVSLGFKYYSCLLPLNGLIYIPKTSNICIKNSKKGKLWTPKFATFGPP
jgi:hypothetical protein